MVKRGVHVYGHLLDAVWMGSPTLGVDRGDRRGHAIWYIHLLEPKLLGRRGGGDGRGTGFRGFAEDIQISTGKRRVVVRIRHRGPG